MAEESTDLHFESGVIHAISYQVSQQHDDLLLCTRLPPTWHHLLSMLIKGTSFFLLSAVKEFSQCFHNLRWLCQLRSIFSSNWNASDCYHWRTRPASCKFQSSSNIFCFSMELAWIPHLVCHKPHWWKPSLLSWSTPSKYMKCPWIFKGAIWYIWICFFTYFVHYTYEKLPQVLLDEACFHQFVVCSNISKPNHFSLKDKTPISHLDQIFKHHSIGELH